MIRFTAVHSVGTQCSTTRTTLTRVVLVERPGSHGGREDSSRVENEEGAGGDKRLREGTQMEFSRDRSTERRGGRHVI